MDSAFSGAVKLRAQEEPGAEGSAEASEWTEEVLLTDGAAPLPPQRARLFTDAAAIVLTAESAQKRAKGKASAQASAPLMQPAQCRLAVSRGKRASKIRLEHPGWDGHRLLLDDSAPDLAGLRGSVLANDGTRIAHVQLLLAYKARSAGGDSEVADETAHSTPSPPDPAVQEFEACRIPFKVKGYDASMVVSEGSVQLLALHGARKPPPLHFKVLRHPGIAHAVILTVGSATILPDQPFDAQLEVRNRLGVPLSHRELTEQSQARCYQSIETCVAIAGDEDKTQLEGLDLKQWVEDGKDALRLSVTVREVVTLAAPVSMELKGTVTIAGEAIESEPCTMTYVSQSQVDKNRKRMQQIADDIDHKTEQKRKIELEQDVDARARNDIASLETQLAKLCTTAVLNQEKKRLEEKLASLQNSSSGLSKATWRAECGPGLQEVLQAREQGRSQQACASSAWRASWGMWRRATR